MKVNEARVTMYESVKHLEQVVKELMKDKGDLMSKGLDGAARVRVNSIDMLQLAIDLIAYADVLNDKFTLKHEGFLIPKYERAQLIIENCKVRILQARK